MTFTSAGAKAVPERNGDRGARVLRRMAVVSVGLSLLVSSISSLRRPVPVEAQNQVNPGANCVVTMANRSAPVNANGSYALPNVPGLIWFCASTGTGLRRLEI